MTETTCKTCKYKSEHPTDPSNLKDIKYACYANPPSASALLVPTPQGGVQMVHINAYPQVNNSTTSCRHYLSAQEDKAFLRYLGESDSEKS